MKNLNFSNDVLSQKRKEQIFINDIKSGIKNHLLEKYKPGRLEDSTIQRGA